MQTEGARRSGAGGNRNANLAARIESLSHRRQQIIRPVLANPRAFVLMSVRDMALALSTGAATVVRIVRGMGFENYRTFQRHLHEASIAYSTSLDTMRAGGTRSAGVEDSINQDVKNINALRGSVDAEQIARIAKQMHAARRILILGGDAAAALVTFLEYTLTLLGLPVVAATGHGRIAHLTRACNSRDMVIAISFRRGLRMTVEGFEKASEKGAYCVAITDTLLSPLAGLARECMIAAVESSSFGVSYVAPMALLNALVADCANVKRRETLKLLREVDAEQRFGSRWYLEERAVLETRTTE